MNVLEAVEKLNNIEDKITSITKSINKLSTYQEFSYDVGVLDEVRRGIIKERDDLKDRLAKTQLTNTRSKRDFL